jgi:hypothetical protein
VMPWAVRNFSPLATDLGEEVSDIGNLGSGRGSVGRWLLAARQSTTEGVCRR